MSNYKILITGASSGFGWDAAKELASKGHTVVATMRGTEGKNAGKAAELRQWGEKEGYQLHVVELDVTDDKSVEQGVGVAVDAAGGLDIVVNNAGVGIWGVGESYDTEQVRNLFDVNYLGMVRMNRAVLPIFRKQGSGLLMYISSGLGRILLPFVSHYAATKFAVEAMAEGISYELAPLGIETTIVQPGAYGTGFMNNSMQPGEGVRLEGYGSVKDNFEAFSNAFMERIQAGQVGDPREVVEAIVDVIDTEPGKRPLRRPVGADIGEPVRAINSTCEQAQDSVFKHMGLRE